MVLCVMLFGCNTDFSNCTSINIRCGTIKVPENWDVSYAENLMYFYSDNANDKKNIYNCYHYILLLQFHLFHLQNSHP